ncbi:MAG: AAA family ATPase, partial [Bryobacteraceae bacterium]
MNQIARLTRVVLENYRSIASCDVQLADLTFLVGLNGAGKSNFIDALRFCRDALRTPLEQAFAGRAANLQTLSHWGSNGKSGFGMRLELSLPALTEPGVTELAPVHYSFSITPQSPRGFEVQREECAVGKIDTGVVYGLVSDQPIHFSRFQVSSGIVNQISPEERRLTSFEIATDRLYLPAAPKVVFREV